MIGTIVAKRDRRRDEAGVQVINRSRDVDYNSQRDNKKYALQSCGPTSMAMALMQAGYKNWTVDGEDPADTITNFLTTETAYRQMYQVIGDRNSPWKPFNVHSVLTWGVNSLIGKSVSEFRTNWSIGQILFNVVCYGGVVLVGDFTLPDGRELGHMVSLAGFTTYQRGLHSHMSFQEIDFDAVKSFIIDDPYGNWYSGYTDFHGNNIEYSRDDFNSIFRRKDDYNSKWAHLIKPIR